MTTITTKTTTQTAWDKIREMPLAIGTEITDTLKDGTPITFEIAALDIYGAKKVLVCKDCLPEEHAMNKRLTNKGGWKDSAMRKHTKDVLELLPDDLKAAIVPRTIKQKLDGDVVECEDLIWLLSSTEVAGAGSWCSESDVDDQQFPLYKTEKARVKECAHHGTWYWWLRSPVASTSTHFANVNGSGHANGNYATASFGVAFGFLL